MKKNTTETLIAFYNGHNFINEQLDSLKNQTLKNDYITLLDDCSPKNDVSFLKDDTSIKMVANLINIGHVKTFEKLLILSKGDYLFLCDQDDVWNLNKIEYVTNFFNENPNVILFHHELDYVDESLVSLNRNDRKLPFGIQKKFKFLIKQFIKPDLFGCGIAFRKKLLPHLLPFPKYVYAHDHWLSIVAPLYGDVYLSSLKLVKYRQHSNNVTPKKKSNLYKIFKFRFKFFLLLLIAFFRKIFK